MKPPHRIDLIFSVSGEKVYSKDVSDWTVHKIADCIKTVKYSWPETDHKFKIKGA